MQPGSWNRERTLVRTLVTLEQVCSLVISIMPMLMSRFDDGTMGSLAEEGQRPLVPPSRFSTCLKLLQNTKLGKTQC